MRTFLQNGVLAVRITRDLFDKAVVSGDLARVQSALRARQKGGKIKIEISIV